MIVKTVNETAGTDATALTIGKFESLHAGHRKLISSVVAYAGANGLIPAVLSFEPNPVRVLADPDYQTVLTVGEKVPVYEKLGLRMLINLHFDRQTAAMPPEDFLGMVFGKLNCRFLAVGERFRFGAGGAGDARLLEREGARRGAKVIVLPNETADGLEISTTSVREALAAGDFPMAEKLLGFPYFVSGEVVSGLKLGRLLGFPTLNLTPPEDKLLPAAGVFLTKTRLAAGIFDGVTNVGTKRLGAGTVRCVETHLFDFNGDAYGQRAEVDFYARLRDEISFGSVEGLREQIGRDAETARRMLRSP
ncbi:MAG: riboflavin biosynthesis protein RibF [Firmicutes bacterium]|nr:riboflavin biosynthesis protein RibF [Bacillota bacterium]